MKISKVEKALIIEGLQLVKMDRQTIVHTTDKHLIHTTPETDTDWYEVAEIHNKTKEEILRIEDLIKRLSSEEI